MDALRIWVLDLGAALLVVAGIGLMFSRAPISEIALVFLVALCSGILSELIQMKRR